MDRSATIGVPAPGVLLPTRPHVVVDRVAKVFETKNGPVEALRAVSLSVSERQFISIIGPSGCGKSTLLRIVGGLLPPTSGQLDVLGRSPRDAQRDKSIGFVFQQPALLPWRTVKDNIELGLNLNREAGAGRLCSTEEILALVGLAAFEKAHPWELSGGMQQRVAIARALIFNPTLLLMDEPFGALDEITRDTMRYELLRIWSQAQKTVLFVTHSIPEAIVLSDRVIVMSPRPGRIQEIIEIELPRPRDEGIELSREFLGYAERLRHLLSASSRAAGHG